MSLSSQASNFWQFAWPTLTFCQICKNPIWFLIKLLYFAHRISLSTSKGAQWKDFKTKRPLVLKSVLVSVYVLLQWAPLVWRPQWQGCLLGASVRRPRPLAQLHRWPFSPCLMQWCLPNSSFKFFRRSSNSFSNSSSRSYINAFFINFNNLDVLINSVLWLYVTGYLMK